MREMRGGRAEKEKGKGRGREREEEGERKMERDEHELKNQKIREETIREPNKKGKIKRDDR